MSDKKTSRIICWITPYAAESLGRVKGDFPRFIAVSVTRTETHTVALCADEGGKQ
ncbi:hypothetical protein [Bombella saccharophila]|uniref:Uncharacterized protein n=1 Tax=Bombella saccharophila TaxID=2967338 RepID=A0ABT3W6J8_9PROT|nr:hypothetical protein [Bombella saccharophila]MCX5614408.1 hypothetical protein [Bombella saccharophila]